MITAEIARQSTERRSSELLDFTQRIVATPSMSGHEGDVAALIVEEMKRLDYDEVWTDEVGNLIGKINGDGGPTILLNGHMDVVDPGPPAGWKFPAFSGRVVDGELWGRGAVDMKGPVAAMIYGAAQFKQLGIRPPGDVYMTVAVMEEIGGLGTQAMLQEFLAKSLKIDAAIVGEPSRCKLRLGHRGRMELQVKFSGKSAHASVPELAINPHFAAAAFLQRLGELSLLVDPVLGPSTIAPTLYVTDQQSANVIPSEVTVFLDWRNVPAETTEVAVQLIESLVGDVLLQYSHQTSGESSFASGAQQKADSVDSLSASVRVSEALLTTYTGATRNFAAMFPAFATAPESKLALAAKSAIEQLMGRPAAAGVWKFATDGGHLMAAGIPTIGFGPGDDRLAHTNQERLSVSELNDATATYASLIMALADWDLFEN